jgi:hypothetical protein
MIQKWEQDLAWSIRPLVLWPMSWDFKLLVVVSYINLLWL